MNDRYKSIGMVLDKNYPTDPRVQNEAMHLIENGFRVHLFCIDYTNENRSSKEIVDGIHIYRVKGNWLIAKFSALAYTLPLYHIFIYFKVLKFINRIEIDHLHVHDIPPARGVFWANKKRLPITLDLHENRPEIMKYYEKVMQFPGKFMIFPKLWKKAEYRLIKKAQKVIVVTKEAKNYYVKETGTDQKKFFIVPNTVKGKFYESPRIKQEIAEKYSNHFTMLYVGNTDKRRGLSTVIRALPKLSKEIPEIKFVIVGTGRNQSNLMKEANDLNISKFVDFQGWQDFNLFPSYMSASKIGISPLHKNIHHDTTYANKVFQYLSLGLPTIVSNCDAQEALIRNYNCGLSFEAKNSDDFAKCVLDLYCNKELYNNCSKNALKAIKSDLNWNNLAKDLLLAYS